MYRSKLMLKEAVNYFIITLSCCPVRCDVSGNVREVDDKEEVSQTEAASFDQKPKARRYIVNIFVFLTLDGREKTQLSSVAVRKTLLFQI